MLNRYFFAPLAALLLVATTQLAHAQTGAVGIGTTAPDASAALDIVSSSKGVLLPRVASAAAIASPAAGLLVYQTGGTPGFYYNSGTAANADWLRLSPADNLGNHIATQNLNLGTNLLTGTGGYTGSAVGIGVRADGGLDLGQNTAGNNLYVGFRAGSANTTQPGGYGTGNQYIGYQSGLRNTTGNRNDFSGFQSGYSNTTGSQNTFGGYLSGSSNTEGHSNTFYGFYSGGGTTTGIGNTFVGSQTGISNRTGTNNTALGINSGPVSGGFGTGPVLNNATAVGANVGLTASNTLILGNEANVGIGTSDPAQKLEVRNGNVLLQSSSSAYVGIRSYSGIVGTVDLGVAATAHSFSPLDQAGDAVLISNRSLVLAGRQGGSVVVGTGANIEQERLRVTSDGNVGIGTSTPAQRLEVAGSVQISGTGSGLLFPDGTTQTTAANAAPTQALALSGQDLSLSPGGNTVTLPTQQLSLSGSTLSLSNGGSVTLPTTPGDNLGNHLATNNIGLNNNWLSNAPGNANGLRIDNLGNVGIGGLPAATGLHIRTAEKNSVSSLPGVFLSGGASGNPNIELRGTNGSAYLDFVNNFTADYDSRILAGNTGLGFYTGGTGTGGGLRMLLASGGAVTLSNLAGSSTRMVTADASGTLAAQPLPTDAQQLSISSTSSGSTISLTNGGSVTLPGISGDNLGNHTATQNLNLGTNTLVGNGTTGLTVTSAGSARLPAASAYTYAAPKAYSATYGISDLQLEQEGSATKLRTTLNGGEFAYATQGMAMRIPLHLPNGATVTGITCYGVDNDPSQNLQGYFISVLPTATGISTPDYSDGFGTSGTPGYVTPVITPGTGTRVIDNNRAYYVLINTSANGCTIGAVRVNYTVTQAE